MQTFNLFTSTNIPPNLNLVYLGIEMNLLEPKALQDYIYWKLENNVPAIDEDFDIISITPSKLDIMETYSKYTTLYNPEIKENTKSKLRLAVLEHLNKTTKNKNKLLVRIEEIYAIFDYPEDMNPFIYYMPSQDASERSEEHIVDQFRSFLNKERARLDL